MLTVKNLTKRYPRPGRAWWSDATVTALDDVSFVLARGSALALWGANGAGKTTLLKCLLGLLDCEGSLHLDGHDLRQSGRAARHFLGYVPQELAFHNGMNVDECCRFYAKLKRAPATRIPVVLAQVGLTEQRRKAVGALSGGMKQRLALALALLADPPVLLLDEPTSNLDARTRDEFIDLLVGLRRAGKTLLFTSHHAEEVDRLADQVLVLEDGRVAALQAVDNQRQTTSLRTAGDVSSMLVGQTNGQRGEFGVPTVEHSIAQTGALPSAIVCRP
ncbi:MAG: ABC transporter ATP-binding protein [Caldilineaceae bacterium]